MENPTPQSHRRSWLAFWPKLVTFAQRNRKLLLTWGIIIVALIGGFLLNIDKSVVVFLVLIFGILAQAFSGLLALLATLPFIGPILVKVLTLPIFWLLNALGYFVSVVAIKKGFAKEVVNYRFVTMVFLIGFAVGFIIAKLI